MAVVLLVGLLVVYGLGYLVVVDQLGLGEFSDFGIYTTTFVLGAWAAVAMTFVANWLAVRFFDGKAIAYKPPEE